MRRQLVLTALVVLGVLPVVAAPAGARSSSAVVAIDKSGFRLGQLVWKWQAHDRSVALADLIRVFGRASTCKLGPSAADAHVVWAHRGVRGEFTTLGGFPHARDTACTAPAAVHPDTVEVFRPAWHTALGLHVGDPVARLRALYPRASRHKDGWWLVTRRKDPLFDTYGQLVAGVRNGRVAYLRLVLHAEGD
jgi:hypothetical protein